MVALVFIGIAIFSLVLLASSPKTDFTDDNPTGKVATPQEAKYYANDPWDIYPKCKGDQACIDKRTEDDEKERRGAEDIRKGFDDAAKRNNAEHACSSANNFTKCMNAHGIY